MANGDRSTTQVRDDHQTVTNPGRPGRRRAAFRLLQGGGAALALAGALLVAFLPDAGATGPPDGSIVPDSAVPVAPYTAGQPFSSGQQINIVIPANSDLPTGSNANVVECAAPGGVPPTDISECDGLTHNGPTLAVNPDGSINFQAETGSLYTLYALPDQASLGESPGGSPQCDLSHECVLYVGENQNDFTQPHYWSQPFYIAPTAGDTGANPGDGSPPAVATAPDPGLSAVSATPATVPADGANTATVTVTLTATGPQPVSGKTVTLSQGSGHSVIGAASGVSDANGRVTFAVSDSTAEAVTYTATDTTDSVTVTQTATVTFAAPTVSAGSSTVVASPQNVPADGTTASTVTVSLRDQGAIPQPEAGRTVTLAQGSGHSVITPASAVTDASGTATFSVTDTADEAVTYHATDTTDSVTLNSVATVVFGTLNVSPSESTVAAQSPAPLTGAGSGVTVTLLAPDGATPIAGKTVSLSTTSGHTAVTPTSAVTGVNGQAQFVVSDPDAESVTLTATDTTDGVVLDQKPTVSFEAAAPSATKSTVASSTTTVPADGQTPVSILVTVNDQFGNPVKNQTVKVSASSKNVDVTPEQVGGTGTAGVTNAAGEVQVLANDEIAESVTFTAVDLSDGNLKLAQTVSATYIPGPPDGMISTLTASPSKVAADGKATSTVTATVKDHFGNPVANHVVSLAASGGTSEVSPASDKVTTGANGQAAFQVTDTAQENVTYQATDETDGLLLTAKVTVTFGNPPVPPADPADSTVVVSSATDPADGTTAATVTVLLYDAAGQPLPDKAVQLLAQGGSAKISPSTSATSNASGQATFTVTDANVEKVTFSAKDTSDNVTLTRTVTVSFVAAPPPTTTTTTSAGGSGCTTCSGSTGLDSTLGTAGTTSGGGSGSGLAFTGAPDGVGWLVWIGLVLLAVGTLGRRRLRHRVVAR
jgi:hypothetical protein